MTVVVDGDLDIVVGEFRDVTKVADGATEVCIHRQDLVFCYIQRVVPKSPKVLLTSPAATVVGDTVNTPNWVASGQL